MADLVVSYYPDSTPGETELMELTLFAGESDWLNLYDRIQVWRSTLTKEGPYEELTASSATTARFPEDAPDVSASPPTGASVPIVGDTLELLVNETWEVTITFTGVAAITLSEAATQVVAQGQGLLNSYVTDDGEFVIETVKVGAGASLSVQGGDAAGPLGLSSLPLVYGKSARPALVPGTEEYNFQDPRGSVDYYYRLRLYNSIDGNQSAFSDPAQGSRIVALTPSNLVLGYVELLRSDGKPDPSVEVAIFPVVGGLIDGKVVTGGRLSKLTDENGRAEFTLVRGQEVDVVVVGTDIVRRVLPPEDADTDTFNMFDASYGTQEDYFKVRVPNIVFAERRSF